LEEGITSSLERSNCHNFNIVCPQIGYSFDTDNDVSANDEMGALEAESISGSDLLRQFLESDDYLSIDEKTLTSFDMESAKSMKSIKLPA
jgi:hypothetical protein